MKKTLIVATALTVSLLPQVGFSADANADLKKRIEKLEEELNLLQRQQEVIQEVAKAKDDKSATVELGSSGLAITSPDKNLAIKLKGYGQFDGRWFGNNKANAARDDILARRLRPTLEIVAGQDFSFTLSPDFAGSTTRVFDSFVNYKYSDKLQFKVGKFKEAISLAQLQSDADTVFIEGGPTLNLVPSRDIGAQVYGELIPQTLEYQLGVFNGTQSLNNADNDDDNKKDLVARVFAQPLRSSDIVALQGFGVGVGGSTGKRAGSTSKSILPSYRTTGQQTFFSYATNTYANGTNWRLVPQTSYYYNNFGLLGEYAIESQDVTKGASSASLENKAWSLTANYIITGENAAYKGGVKPEKNFSPKDGTWGAFEAVARVGEISLDKDAFPTFADLNTSAEKAFSVGGGVNWYLNTNVKVALDYEQTSFDRGAAAGADRKDEQVVLSRVQFRF